MNRRACTTTLLLMLLCAVATAQSRQQREQPRFNFGLKGGFASTIYQISDLVINDVSLADAVDETTRVGYFATLFARVNFDRHFVQTELTFNVSRFTLGIDKNKWYSDDDDFPSAIAGETAEYSLTNKAIEVPLLYGYNFVRTGPYRMCFFVGPKAKFNLRGISKQKVQNFNRSAISEQPGTANFSLTAGLGINISKIFFDFTYEVGLQNIGGTFSTDNPTDHIKFNRRKDVLAFSVGVLL